jgi:hypothetical protein
MKMPVEVEAKTHAGLCSVDPEGKSIPASSWKIVMPMIIRPNIYHGSMDGKRREIAIFLVS